MKRAARRSQGGCYRCGSSETLGFSFSPHGSTRRVATPRVCSPENSFAKSNYRNLVAQTLFGTWLPDAYSRAARPPRCCGYRPPEYTMAKTEATWAAPRGRPSCNQVIAAFLLLPGLAMETSIPLCHRRFVCRPSSRHQSPASISEQFHWRSAQVLGEAASPL